MLVALSSDTVKQLLTDLQAAHDLAARLQADGADVRGEESRLDTIDERIVKSARNIVKYLGGRQGLIALRNQLAPGTTERWWLLDRELDVARSRLVRQLAVIAAVIVIIIVAGYIARPVLFPPDPVGDAEAAASRELQQNNVPRALQSIDSALVNLPTNTELLIWKGVLLKTSGDITASQQTYEQAMRAAGSDKEFYLVRALTYVRLGDSASVITDTTTIIQKYPDYAEAYYVRATGYEGVGNRNAAIADLDKCSTLAQATGDDTLFAQSRIRLATLLQAGP